MSRYLSYAPPAYEYGTRPFLRWVLSQGRRVLDTWEDLLKESEKKDKYLDLTRELKKQWNTKVTIIPIVIGALGKVTKELIQGLEVLEIRGWVESI